MYLIKNICFDHRTNNVKVEDGIQVGIICKTTVVARDEFWGRTKLYIGDYADCTKISVTNPTFNLLSYVNAYEVKDIGDGFKELSFLVNEYVADEKEGYIVFVKQSIKEIKTNGQKIFGRYPTEIVVVLKDGDFIELEDRRIEVVGGRLTLIL